MAEKKRRRPRFRPRLFLMCILLLALAFLFLADPLFNLDFGLLKTDSTATSVAVLTEVRDVFALNTIEFIYKTVFPHDFMTAGADWAQVLQKRREGMHLSETDKKNLEVYDLCRELGISVWRENYDFVVVTSIVKGGFDLTDTVYRNPEAYPGKMSRAVRIDDDTVTLLLPEPVITDFIIEDNTSATYTYPDMDIDPEDWKLLAGFIRGRVEDIVKDEGILEMAREKGEVFIERMLKDAGYRKVVFLEDQPPR